MRLKANQKKPSLGPEGIVQQMVCSYLKLQYPDASSYIIKIHNEGKRSLWTNMMLKKLGFCPKASDLFIAFPRSPYHGFFLEIKPDNFKICTSNKAHYDGQMEFLSRMRLVNYFAEMGVGFDHCKLLIDCYFGDK